MKRRLALVTGLVWTFLAPRAASLAGDPAPASDWIAREAVVAIEVSRPEMILDKVLDPGVAEVITAIPAARKLLAQPGYQQFVGLVGLLESRLGMDWRTGLRNLVAGGITFAAKVDGGTLLIIDAKDRKVLDQLHNFLFDLAKAEAQKQGRPEQVSSKDYRGTTTWTFGPNEAHAIVGNRLIVANRRDALESVLDLRAEAGIKGLSSHAGFKAAREAAGDAPAMAYLNLAILKLAPGVGKALSEAKNPLTSLLFAGLTEAFQESTWFSLAARLDGAALEVEATVDGSARGKSGAAAFAVPAKPDQGALPNLSVPRRIAGLTFYRDLHGFYAAKDELFPERTSGLIFFENMMGIFFSGMDLTEEVLAETGPEVRFVVANQAYDPAIGTPQVQIPAFAAVFRLRHPKEFGEVVEEAWQKALGLINFTRGQQALPGLVIDRVNRGEIKLSVASFRPPKPQDNKAIDSRYNFRPALARAGEFLILSSTDGLAGDLIDALAKEAASPRRPRPSATSLLTLDGPQIVSLLRADRENMVLQNMTEKGHAREEAEQEIDLLTTLADCVGKTRLSLAIPEGRPRASLKIEFKAPRAARREVLRRTEAESPQRVASDREEEARREL
jgi:hypothetical protein